MMWRATWIASTRAISKSGEALRDQTHREVVNRPFEFNKRIQLFIGTHDETLAIAVRVNNANCASIIVES
jgi:hypothetical protein